MQRHIVSLAVLALCTLVGSALADESPIVASDAWARPTLKGTSTGAVYLILRNRGTAGDRLVAVSTPAAERAEIHEDVTDNGIMSMKPVPELSLPASTSTAIEPGRYHIMLIGVKAPLSAGQNFPITLTFASAPPLEVTVSVTRTPPKSASMP
ncbi:MAG TPA: copper chaperone PCu(A)C [Stellaceae bacterium]|nr:copper chaperone PCu(A)C [Stellaceae bacterium]